MRFYPGFHFFALCVLTVARSFGGSETLSVQAPFPMPPIPVATFPARDFPITDFGAKQIPANPESGQSDSTSELSALTATTNAFRRAIQACAEAGGGRVIVPPGRWLTGAIHLRSNVNLHLADGAVLEFSADPKDYLPAVQSSWEGMECFNYSPLIYAFDCDNIAITGKGTLLARLDTWREWFKRPPAHMAALKQLYEMMSKDVPVAERQMAVGENNLRPQFIQFNRCRRVLIEDIKIRNSPFWVVHLLLCDGAIVRRIDVSAHGHNNDGIDPEMTRNLLVEDCVFDQGDDAIAIKSGSNRDGWRLATSSENIVMRRCVMKRGHQLVAIGSELSGGIRNVYIHDCRFENSPDDKPQHILFIKTNRRRGGFVENIHVENITARSTKIGVFGIETDVLYQWRNLVPTYEERLTPIRGIHFRNVTVDETDTPFRILGDPQLPVKDIVIENVTITKITGKPSRYENVEGIQERNIHIGSSP
ncbi:polygalacturonase [Nibricoccus aquaticus]|uniref:Polygalacturonase n=1 Tax=Nibricoccus aquaticus TaxID=2576891 RepID=A0A290QCD4_9BACT|nr:polygalacturonase [Nibricoccus aquaticus]